MTSEVTSDLGIELLDLHYLCSRVSLASKCLYELNATTTTTAEEAKHDPLTCVASPQVINCPHLFVGLFSFFPHKTSSHSISPLFTAQRLEPSHTISRGGLIPRFKKWAIFIREMPGFMREGLLDILSFLSTLGSNSINTISLLP